MASRMLLYWRFPEERNLQSRGHHRRTNCSCGKMTVASGGRHEGPIHMKGLIQHSTIDSNIRILNPLKGKIYYCRIDSM
jgi:hypothetical protein